MSDPMYWVTALVLSISLALILVHERRMIQSPVKEEKAFRRLLCWGLFFGLQDVLWGLLSSTNTLGDLPLFLSSTVFHVSTVLTTYFWLDYVLTYMGDEIRHRRLYLLLDGAVIGLQAAMLIANFFVPTIFSIRGGIYHTEFLRPLAFANQYMVYLLIGVLTLVKALRTRDILHNKFFTVLWFAAAPIFTGVFQLLYPQAPFYTIGYFLGIIIIHLFIVMTKHMEMQALQHEMDNRINEARLAEQTLLSYTDQLTGLRNRRAYEERLAEDPNDPLLVCIAIDVNELKIINDSMGHSTGDELLTGTAECLRTTFGQAGDVYRIGGDEFTVILSADSDKVSAMLERFLAKAACWQGKTVRRLSVSYGVAPRSEFPGLGIQELLRIADERMYRYKSAYYLSMGIDRQGQQKAYAALCASYEKILRVNLTADSYLVVSMDESEKILEKGYSLHISEWLHDFGTSGQVHPDDLADYLAKTDITFLRRYFAAGSRYLCLFYRRRAGDEYCRVMMELLSAESDGAAGGQMLYLYVKQLEKTGAE